ncbi:PhzF family phenazine biosynthesis protein [Sphaerobacter thermophilus]|uniref:Phenazine biosynthesis protein PhzF family n=1 Tax=Sphaerobacter thermophilus (strain ATCC 49802 / DSM 20745 / KCCM 41009 / NCIMB 13125 / S 6022) TaxID=479434 RepID=D1C9F9_SPHTD|nr:PhzF family phenazine biosynthesis protein [Sphaerobacter thermophilus]ACZ40452.1 phenazine biosynthesis protein PhzF family [Sphaerobacter thermophilus DSM 20745]
MSAGATRTYSFVQVDVFTDRQFGGNPLAVFLDGTGLSDAEMQAIAREMNLSETTFVLPPERDDCVARVRIFTPGRELPFAGHPTVGTAYVLATSGRVPAGATEFALEERVGPVPVRLEGDPNAPTFIWMRHPAATFGPPREGRAQLAAALGLDEADLLPDVPVCVGSTGVPFLYIPLRDPATVDRVVVDLPALSAWFGDEELVGTFVFAPNPAAGPNRVYSRMIAAHGIGIAEDPATGSASGPLGAYLVRHGLVASSDEVRIVSEQGTKIGRQSFVHITVRSRPDGGEEIEVGGGTVPVLEGTLRIA